jgi:hypothetical protein
MSTRRKFLIHCSTAVAVAVFAPIGATGMLCPSRWSTFAADNLSHADFAGQIDTDFRVHLGLLRGATLKLVRSPLAPPYRQSSGRRSALADSERFSLIFSGPRNELLPDGIHRFEHSRLGRLEMFVAQIGRGDAEQVRYEAVFNRPAGGPLLPG